MEPEGSLTQSQEPTTIFFITYWIHAKISERESLCSVQSAVSQTDQHYSELAPTFSELNWLLGYSV